MPRASEGGASTGDPPASHHAPCTRMSHQPRPGRLYESAGRLGCWLSHVRKPYAEFVSGYCGVKTSRTYAADSSRTGAPSRSAHQPPLTKSCPSRSIAEHGSRLSPPAWTWADSVWPANMFGTPSGIASRRVAQCTDASRVTCSSSQMSSCRCEPESYAKAVPGGFWPRPETMERRWRVVTSGQYGPQSAVGSRPYSASGASRSSVPSACAIPMSAAVPSFIAESIE
mmetsp:Transcript_3483/g.11311  ORF Transcript_3483/g.11311 Transcript_3483/m.11311 type:complete len:227 (-) Transcript_3483:99-779(-)